MASASSNTSNQHDHYADEDDASKNTCKSRCIHGHEDFTRSLLLIVTCLYIFLYAGAFFGWGPMQIMLENNGAYSSRCQANEPTPCPSQTAMLLNVQFVAQLTFMTSPILGTSIDKLGPFVMINVLGFLGASGLALLTASTYFHIDGMLFPAFLLLALMANVGGLFTVQTGLVYPRGRSRNRAISALNSIFDAGAITYLGLWNIEQHTALDLPTISLIYLGIFVVIVGIASVCWRYAHRLIDEANDDDSSSKISAENTETQPNDIEQDIDTSTANQLDEMFVSDEKPEDADSGFTKPLRESYIAVADRAPVKQFLSSNYICLAAFFSFHQSRNIWILTTTRDFLAYLGDNKTGNRYLSIFTLLTPASVLGLPFVDFILHRFGYGVGLHVVNFLAIIQGIVQVSSTNLNVQIIGFVFYSFYRCFLFSVCFSCLPAFMSEAIVGRGYGFLILGGGLLGLINIPLSNVAVTKLGGNFFIPNTIYLVLCLPCAFFAYGLGRGFKREKKEQLARLRQSKIIAAG